MMARTVEYRRVGCTRARSLDASSRCE